MKGSWCQRENKQERECHRPLTLAPMVAAGFGSQIRTCRNGFYNLH